MKLNKKIHTVNVIVPNSSSCDVTTDGHTFSFDFEFDNDEYSCDCNE